MMKALGFTPRYMKRMRLMASLSEADFTALLKRADPAAAIDKAIDRELRRSCGSGRKPTVGHGSRRTSTPRAKASSINAPTDAPSTSDVLDCVGAILYVTTAVQQMEQPDRDEDQPWQAQAGWPRPSLQAWRFREPCWPPT